MSNLPKTPFQNSFGMVISPDKIKISVGYEPTEHEIRKVGKHITKDGLIEPLKLDKIGELGKLDCWDPARLEFCRRNNWPTVIVAYESPRSGR